jgi:SAM-dependent methyltransferase
VIDVGCYLCGSDRAVTLFEQTFQDPYLNLVNPELNAVTRHWKACADCGFVYRTPMLSESEQETLYRNYGDDVFKKESPDAYFDRIASMPPSESENHAKAVWLKDRLERVGTLLSVAGSLSVLDVGCGAGLLMRKLKDVLPIPLDLCGVELNPDYAALAARRLRGDIRRVDYRPGLFGRKFSLVMCTKVLEHVRDPENFVGRLTDDLADGGVLFLEVPDIMDVENLPAEHDRFFIPHIYFFSPNAMAEILSRLGLGVISSRSVTTPSGRSYLQVLAGRSVPAAKTSKPYDDAAALLKARRAKFTN